MQKVSYEALSLTAGGIAHVSSVFVPSISAPLPEWLVELMKELNGPVLRPL